MNLDYDLEKLLERTKTVWIPRVDLLDVIYGLNRVSVLSPLSNALLRFRDCVERLYIESYFKRGLSCPSGTAFRLIMADPKHGIRSAMVNQLATLALSNRRYYWVKTAIYAFTIDDPELVVMYRKLITQLKLSQLSQFSYHDEPSKVHRIFSAND